MTHITTEIVHWPGHPEPLVRVIVDDGLDVRTHLHVPRSGHPIAGGLWDIEDADEMEHWTQDVLDAHGGPWAAHVRDRLLASIPDWDLALARKHRHADAALAARRAFRQLGADGMGI